MNEKKITIYFDESDNAWFAKREDFVEITVSDFGAGDSPEKALSSLLETEKG